MTYYLKDYDGDALAITDKEVAEDWRLGLLRGVARVMESSALPRDSSGPYGRVVEGSNREHIRGGRGIPYCPIVEIYEVEEDKGTDYNTSTYGGEETSTIILRGRASCACGRMVKHPVETMITPGRLITAVTNAD